MDDPTPIPKVPSQKLPRQKLRRAWLAGYRVGDVEVLLAELRFKVTHLRDETERLTVRLSEVERHRAEIGEAPAQPVTAAVREPDPVAPVIEPVVEPIIEPVVEPGPGPAQVALPGAILSAQYSPAMASEPVLRRTRFGGFRRSDVEAAMAHDQLVVSRLELELHAATQRGNALQARGRRAPGADRRRGASGNCRLRGHSTSSNSAAIRSTASRAIVPINLCVTPRTWSRR